MSEHTTDAIVVHCIDFRFQKYLDPWLHEHFGHDNYERHKTDLEEAERKFEALFPGLDVETYYLHPICLGTAHKT